jgi:signal transduction histidine kinase
MEGSRKTTPPALPVHTLDQTNAAPDLQALNGWLAQDLSSSLTTIMTATEKAQAILDSGGTLAPATFDLLNTAIQHCSNLAKCLAAEGPQGARSAGPIDLAMTLKELKPLLKPLLPDRLRLELVLPTSPVHVLASPAQIQQITCNLVLSAKDAIAGSGTITITLDAPQETDGKRMARIRVSDDGQGIPVEALVKIFRPYFTAKPEGNGGGLRRAKAIIEKLGGFIDVESDGDRGTAFVMHFPTPVPRVWPC